MNASEWVFEDEEEDEIDEVPALECFFFEEPEDCCVVILEPLGDSFVIVGFNGDDDAVAVGRDIPVLSIGVGGTSKGLSSVFIFFMKKKKEPLKND